MYHCFRLRRGQDLYEEIEAYVKAHHIAAGAVVSGVGCVSRWRLRETRPVSGCAAERRMRRSSP